MDIRLNPFHADRSTRDLRQEMVEETSAFLTWALAEERGLPRIPRRPVDQGGFSHILLHPGARQLVAHWWSKVLQAGERE